MRKILVGSALAVAVGISALGVAAIDPVGAVSAAVTGKAHAHPGPLEQTLDDLVGKGTITQSQADAVTSEVQAKREEGWARRPRLGKQLLTSVAEQLGMDPKALLTELKSGKSVADVAHEKSVDPQTIIDKIVSTLDGQVDARVAAHKMDQAKADVMKQNLPARVTEFVNKVRGNGAKADAQSRPPTTDTPSTGAPMTTVPDSITSSAAPDSTNTTAATPSGTTGN